MKTPAADAPEAHAHRRRRIVRAPAQLFLLGFLTLFLELLLIRYLPGSIWNLGYFPNLVLLAVFLGMGMGFVFHAAFAGPRSDLAFGGAAAGFAALIAFVYFKHPMMPGFESLVGEVGGEIYFSNTPGGARGEAVPMFAACFLGILAIFAAISQRTAKVFRTFPPLTAYTLDILGSCAGIVSFMAVSWLQLPAFLWLLALIPLFVLAADARSRWRWALVAPLALAAFLAYKGDEQLTSDPRIRPLEVRWSPYQKVELSASVGAHPVIFVNGIGHQEIWRADELGQSFYAKPYETRARSPELPPYKTVLVIGAGCGNDVAAALHFGAEHVDAVEIDPAIASIGRTHNTAKPYADSRVHLVIDDGRAFMTRTKRRYDLVIFALTDSLVRVSSMAQLRLENYLFTEESLRRAYGLLTDRGDVVLYNYYRHNWLGEKLQRMMHAATGSYPRTIHRDQDFYMFVAGRGTGAVAAPTFKEERMPLAADDWPFPYLRRRAIPSLYAGGMAAVAVLLAGLMVGLHRQGRGTEGGGRFNTKLAFFFMGAAFLLLETKSVVQFSLLFGTTWLNSSLVFLAVLLLVLAANWTAVALRARPKVLVPIYGALIASCLVTLFYPLSRLLQFESSAARFALGSLLTFLPIFFANLIFSLTFRDQPAPEHVFGWNLLGAALGGVLEYSSMAVGYTALAALVAACYTLVVALLTGGGGRRHRRVVRPAPA
jgi:hypothetical protein